MRVLDELDHAALLLANEPRRPQVKILAMPSFSARWLVPRLTRLKAARIDVDLELATSIWDSDYHQDRFDIAIHYSDGAWPGATLLMHDGLVPVMSPRLLTRPSLEHVEALGQFCWLHDALRNTKWDQWLAASRIDGLKSERRVVLQDADATLTAAVEGVGIAMGHTVLIENDIREGRLIEAWPKRVPLAAGYHLIQSKRCARSPAAQAVAKWLLEEAAIFGRMQSDR
ncbi:LysR substrate-binding domain-containing protein [Pigmentiphaga aceris]|uniref:LysR substrate-binding domain-containing protein n=1 Tax=Pigmentiphaga aceris TaxID=1940612 RepID=UPI001FEA2346|nr:LysR substrate-binding domain-containing protein [Pigmentiphaga aceris]